MRNAMFLSSQDGGDLDRFADLSALPTRVRRGRSEPGGVVTIAPDHVSIRPADDAAGQPTKVTPMRTYRGLAVTVEASAAGAPRFRLELLHNDRDRSVLLASGRCAEAISREWKAWGRALSLPLIAVGSDGMVHAALHPLGAVMAETPSPRRKGSPLVGRRSRFSRRRPVGAAGETRVYRDEREIIARV